MLIEEEDILYTWFKVKKIPQKCFLLIRKIHELICFQPMGFLQENNNY